MISAEDERQETLFKGMLGDFREAAAGFGDFAQILGVLFTEVLFFGLLHGDVADVVDLMAELLQARQEAGYAERGRTHVNAATALAEIHRHADDANFLWHDVSVQFTRARN
jgi:hypothetical protein